MATKQEKDRNALVQCENCGEYYSVTYRQCPFCDEYEDEDFDGEERPHSGGKRLVNNTRGGGYGKGWTPLRILITVVSIVIIIAAGCIVFNFIKPLIDRGKVPPVVDTPTPPPVTESVLPTPGGDDTQPPVPPGESEVPGTTAPTVTPAPTPSQIPSTQTATGFTINKDDFTLSRAGETYRIKATFTPAGSTGFIDWSSSDPNVATVAGDGTVTGVSKGMVTITATMAGGAKRTCIVRCTFAGGSGETPATATPSAAPSMTTGTLGLNRADFTLSREGETFRLKVSGTESTPAWASSNTGVASVGGDGTVTAESEGTCTVTATVDGKSLKCVVRVNYD